MRFILACLLLCASSAAVAQELVCVPRGELIARLAEKFREVPVGVGIAQNGALLEIIASPDGSTWTLLVTSVDGTSCVTATGTDWQQRTDPGPGA